MVRETLTSHLSQELVTISDNFGVFSFLNDSSLKLSSDDRASPFNLVDVFDREEEGFVEGSLGVWDVSVYSFHELLDR